LQSIKKIIVSIVLLAILIGLMILGVLFFVRVGENHNHLTLYGNVDVRQVDISFRVSGKVEQLLFEEGDFVREGMLMATLEKTPYDDQVRQAAANLEAIKSNLKNAEILLKRRKELIVVGGVSQEDLDNAQSNRDQLQADLYAAEAALAVARDNLDYIKTSCPTDGTILSRIREPGTVVNPSDPIYTLSVASPVWIRAYVDEPHLGKVYFGMSAEIRTDTKGGLVYMGKVGFISPMAEFTPKTVQSAELRTDLVYRLRIYVDNPDQGLKQGMPVTVKLLTDKNRTENHGD
jgi:HlyD family secretion protein